MGQDLSPFLHKIREVAAKLCHANIIQYMGGNIFDEKYYLTIELSERQGKGLLWLGRALGPAYIGSEIAKDIACISGKTEAGDLAIGTGVLISDVAVLTCAHVVDDMKVDETIQIGGVEFAVRDVASHEVADVGLIFLQEGAVKNKLQDLAFRSAVTLESVVIAGYPTIPTAISTCLTLQSGEICGHVPDTIYKTPLDLFSAIARPGNSGGPVVGLDGRIVGLVTRSLERQREEADAMPPMPFFASVPSQVIAECVKELSNGAITLPWEDYD